MKKIKKIVVTAILLATTSFYAQVGIGTTTPHASALLDVTSTTLGFLPPRMTQAQRDAIASPAAGLIIWCTDCGSSGEFQGYNGSSWTNLVGGVASVVPGTITSITCGSATNNGTLISGVAASSVSSVISYTAGNGGPHNGQTVFSTGVTGLTATLSAGTFASGAGTLTYTITGTPSGTGTASFAVNIGGQTCTLTRTVAAGAIASINCSGTNNGTLVNGVAASGVNSVLSYTGGNAGSHSGQTVTSTGVTGLTATLSAGTFANGSGTLTYTITGTPTSSGTASFAVNIGGQTCTLVRTVYVNCGGPVTFTYNGTSVTYGVVASPNGKCWLDRNLGASQVATSIYDILSYGDLFQWGRGVDGHQIRTSAVITTLSTTDSPGHGNFIINGTDWRSPKNDNLWQGVNGINNPCPSGFRLPTYTELDNERQSWSSSNVDGAFASLLKLPAAGFRDSGYQSIGSYWTSSVNGLFAGSMDVNSSNSYLYYNHRFAGSSVRCIKN